MWSATSQHQPHSTLGATIPPPQPDSRAIIPPPPKPAPSSWTQLVQPRASAAGEVATPEPRIPAARATPATQFVNFFIRVPHLGRIHVRSMSTSLRRH